MQKDYVELSCLQCGYTNLMCVAPEFLRGDRHHCPRCRLQCWALAPREVVEDSDPEGEEGGGKGRPKIIYRSTSPAFPASPGQC
jgi:hypothetical protein